MKTEPENKRKPSLWQELGLFARVTGGSVFEGIWRTLVFALCVLVPLGILIWKLYGRIYFYF